MDKKIALLYSFEQKAFHIETLSDYLRSNIICTIRESVNQFRLIALFDTDTEADELIEKLRKKFNW